MVRPLIFTTLVLVNRSCTLPVFRTLRTPNRVLWLLLGLTLAMLLTTLISARPGSFSASCPYRWPGWMVRPGRPDWRGLGGRGQGGREVA